MRIFYPIFGLAVIALYVVMARAGYEPFAVSSERTEARPVQARTTAGGPRGHSTFIWLGGYGGK